MKRFSAVLAIVAIGMLACASVSHAQCGVASAQPIIGQSGCGVGASGCGVQGNTLAGRTFAVQGQSQGCGVQAQQQTRIRFDGPDIVPAPAPIISTSVAAINMAKQHTVGAPTLACDGSVDNHCATVVARPARVVQVPTDRGFFYTERRTGLLGLRGKVVQYHEYGAQRQ